MANSMGRTRKRNASVKWKIFLFLLGFCLLLLVILWLFQTVFLESFYASIKLSQVSKEAESLAILVTEGNRETFEDNVKKRGDLHVELVNASGEAQVVEGYFPEYYMSIGSKETRKELYEQALKNGGSLSLRYHTQDYSSIKPPNGGSFDENMPDADFEEVFSNGQADAGPYPDIPGMRKKNESESVLHAKIITTSDGDETMLLVWAVITPVSATVDTLRLQLLIISGIMAVLAVGIALLIASRISKPIITLNEAASQLGAGDYSVEFKGQGYREVAQLSDTLNHTAKELGKTEELRRDLIANVSHDLRTPLTLITGYAEMMRDIPGENNAENMQVIIDEAVRLSSLVGDLLDLSQLQSGTIGLHIEPIDLTSEIVGIIERFKKFSEPEGFQVLFENKNEKVTVLADSGRISQVVYNFLTNAMNHSGKDKTICVVQRVENRRVRVEVMDTGEGISPEQLPYIWERYYKAEALHKRAIAGAGLGLSIVKSILDQHPGVEYGVESELGQGSTFWFSLPADEWQR